METSAKDGSCVREVFDTMVKELTGQAELHAKDREEVGWKTLDTVLFSFP